MLAVAVEELPLGTRHQACCRRANLKDATQILVASAADIQTLQGLVGSDGVHDIRRAAAVAQAPPCFSLLDICRQEGIVASADETRAETLGDRTGNEKEAVPQSRVLDTEGSGLAEQDDVNVYCSAAVISLGDSALDDLLGGGLHAGHLGEIVGQSATGKTQIALQATVFAALAFEPLPSEAEANQIAQLNFGAEDDTVSALRGVGIKDAKSRLNVAFLSPEGQGEAQRMTRRLLEICDALIAERWLLATNVECAAFNASSSSSSTSTMQVRQRRGRFSNDEKRRYSLEEAQKIARRQLLDNVHFAVHSDYESLEHALTYFVPGLACSLARQNGARLGLIVVDDLPAVINEEIEATSSSRMQSAIARSRIVCDVADRLKRAAALCGRAFSSSKYIPATPAAILAVNHVVDASDRERELLAPIIGDLLDEQISMSLGGESSHMTQDEVISEAPSSAALQELHFSGILAHLDESVLASAKERYLHGRSFQTDDETLCEFVGPSATSGNRILVTREEAIASVLAHLRIASLGYPWVNSVNSRLVLTKTAKTVSLPQRVLWPNASRRKKRGQPIPSDEAGLRDMEAKSIEAMRRLQRPLKIGVRRAVAVLSPVSPAGQGAKYGVDYVILPAGVRAMSALPLPKKRPSNDEGGTQLSPTSLVGSPEWAIRGPEDNLSAEDFSTNERYEKGIGGDADLWSSVDDTTALDDVELSQALARHEGSTDSDLPSLDGAYTPA